MGKTLNVIDAMMGKGKTTAMIRYMNEAPKHRKFIFCTPLLEQVERVIMECPDRSFIAPSDEFMSKTTNLKMLIQKEVNIATTHALFLLFDDELREMIRERHYTLVVDEALDVIQKMAITPSDIQILTNGLCEILEDGRVIWTAPDYDGRFLDYRAELMNKAVFAYNDRTLISMCKIENFEVFHEVFLMTYLFQGHPFKAYFDIHQWEYKQWYVAGDSHETYALSSQPVTYVFPDFRKLITVKHKFRGDRLTTEDTSLSKNWYQKNSQPMSPDMKLLRKHLESFFRTYNDSSTSLNMWTTFKQYQSALQASRYAAGFVPCNAKGTNIYRHKTTLAYAINRYYDPNVANMIHRLGGTFDQDEFALTEMVQWVWRSAIRDGKPITLYIPSDRAYKIFTTWLNSLNYDS